MCFVILVSWELNRKKKTQLSQVVSVRTYTLEKGRNLGLEERKPGEHLQENRRREGIISAFSTCPRSCQARFCPSPELATLGKLRRNKVMCKVQSKDQKT